MDKRAKSKLTKAVKVRLERLAAEKHGIVTEDDIVAELCKPPRLFSIVPVRIDPRPTALRDAG